MSDKAAKKKQFILDTAKKVFAEKGFKNVTMKDIVEACEISRGGLYLYFDSTDSIFEEIMTAETVGERAYIENFSQKQLSAAEKLAWFFAEQKKQILHSGTGLTVALYEYLFHKHEMAEMPENAISNRESLLAALTVLIEDGVELGDFDTDDAYGAAKHILFVLDGIKLAGVTVGISEEEMDDEFVYILSGLIAEEG